MNRSFDVPVENHVGASMHMSLNGKTHHAELLTRTRHGIPLLTFVSIVLLSAGVLNEDNAS